MPYAEDERLDNCTQWQKQPHIYFFKQPWPDTITEIVDEQVDVKKGRMTLDATIEMELDLQRLFNGQFRRVEIGRTSEPDEIGVIGHWLDSTGKQCRTQLGWLPVKTVRKINKLPTGTNVAARINSIHLVNKYGDGPKLVVDIGRSETLQ